MKRRRVAKINKKNNISKVDVENFLEILFDKEIEKFRKSMNSFLRDFESEQLNSFKDYFSDKLLSGFSSKNNTNNSRNLSERQLFSGVFDNFIKNFF